MLDLAIKIVILIIIVIIIVVLGSIGIINGILEGIFHSIYGYFEALKFSLGKVYPMEKRDNFAEPAEEKYFFYRQYEDLKNTFTSAVGVNRGKVLLMKKNMYDKDKVNLKKLKAYQISLYLFGNIFIGIYGGIHFLIITIISIPIYIFYYVVIILKKVKRIRGRISNVCPHCYKKFELPYYVCVSCGRVHKRLVPGAYGIIKRKCACGEIIPCAFLEKTNKVKAICPSCSREVQVGDNAPVCISVVGLKSSGKTSFIIAAINSLLNNISKEKQWNTEFIKENFVDKDNSKVYNIFINSKKFSSKKLLYMYDIAGENFNNKDSIKRQKYYNYVHGVIFVIDISSLINGGEINKRQIGSKGISEINDLLDRFIFTLREIREIKFEESIDVPIAILINKMDCVEIKDNVEDFLNKVGGEMIIRKLGYNFENYRVFPCVSKGNYSNEETDINYVEEPVKWILGEANNELK
ncbi:GTPase SAR1 family protein [Clostridium tetanomorphum]|uniref:GTPase domain-containing protein n=1 Tax=Clostridium tetanomorphum TaxID=1553 RepID=A0A923EAC3_CLOTT|nr:GTPase domain-containing protein [Clostridium tetanomorphum]KAJ53566.1 hypothetical protein CTM_01744 [Clostridium tetanomorphum DSM 665]MBC2398061.1 GTPase domain-containing protein [Clostridium tetanomorphum]MBP1864627.1 GTPase SAR1 family protein [Clostridium tetanomorphum]NRS84097.1 GTPase SAR1 family protein [Clostridium tetanomorphum]NRZ97310.1 GTPase SAR1 family protein [Clostridium tetanomorphum]